MNIDNGGVLDIDGHSPTIYSLTVADGNVIDSAAVKGSLTATGQFEPVRGHGQREFGGRGTSVQAGHPRSRRRHGDPQRRRHLDRHRVRERGNA